MHTIRPLPDAGDRHWYGHYEDLDLATRELQTQSHQRPVIYRQEDPVSTCPIAHTFGRIPAVTLYSLAGKRFHADVFADEHTVTVHFPDPATFVAVLT